MHLNRFLILLGLFIVVQFAHAGAQDLQGKSVVAEVGEEKIFREELDAELNSRFKEIVAVLEPKELRLLEKEILTRMIEQELLIRAAELRISPPGEDEVSSVIDSLGVKSADLPGGSRQGNLRDYIARYLMIRRYVERYLFKKVKVEEEDVVEIYKSSLMALTDPERVQVYQILFRIPPNATRAEEEMAAKRAEQVRLLALDPRADFSEIAAKYSEGSRRRKGGDLGFVSRTKMDPRLADALFSLAPGEISSVVKTEAGYHILKAGERREAKAPSYEEVRERLFYKARRDKEQILLANHLKRLWQSSRVIIYLN